MELLPERETRPAHFAGYQTGGVAINRVSFLRPVSKHAIHSSVFLGFLFLHPLFLSFPLAVRFLSKMRGVLSPVQFPCIQLFYPRTFSFPVPVAMAALARSFGRVICLRFIIIWLRTNVSFGGLARLSAAKMERSRAVNFGLQAVQPLFDEHARWRGLSKELFAKIVATIFQKFPVDYAGKWSQWLRDRIRCKWSIARCNFSW